MKSLRLATFLIAACAFSSLALAQGSTASVIDLTTNSVVSHFFGGTDSACVAWGSNSVAYIMQDDALVRYDMTVSPPGITNVYPGVSGKFAINPANTRALLSEALLDLTTTPYTVLFTDPVIPLANAMAFYSAGTRAVMVDSNLFYVLDMTASPPTSTSVNMVNDISGAPSLVNTFPISGLTEISAVAVNPVSGVILIRGDEGVALVLTPRSPESPQSSTTRASRGAPRSASPSIRPGPRRSCSTKMHPCPSPCRPFHPGCLVCWLWRLGLQDSWC